MAGNVMELSMATYQREVVQSDLPVLVDFWAPWCGPCRMVAPLVEKLSAQYAGKVKFAKVNIDENGALATSNRVVSIPTLVLFKGGQEAGRVVGANPPAIEQLLSKA